METSAIVVTPTGRRFVYPNARVVVDGDTLTIYSLSVSQIVAAHARGFWQYAYDEPYDGGVK